MCGIFGVAYEDSSHTPSDAELRRSVMAMQHRGPDASGVWSAPGVGFAHARLSLVDPNPRSNQPMWDPTGRYALVYNGEIYNFRELRSELEQEGVDFRTTSDTEVLLQGLIHRRAEDILPRLGGMFAFAFVDTESRRVLLARDRFGMKPLFLHQGSGQVTFASEVKALQPWIDLRPDPFSISSYLLGFGGPTKGATFYEGIESVAPGGYAVIEAGRALRHGTFFSMPDFLDAGEIDRLAGFSPSRIVDYMEELMYASVERHMFADCLVGAYCSGGVDSSLLMAMAAKQRGNLAIFHANVMGPLSELDAATALSKALGLDLNVVDVAEQDFVDQMPDVIRQYEYPHTYHPNCAPFMMVSRLARDSGVKGMLSGEGSDELFLGYPWLGRQRLVNAYYRAGARLRRLVHRIPELGPILWPEPPTSHESVRDLLNRREVADDRRRAREAFERLGTRAVDRGHLTSIDYLDYHLRTLLLRNDTQGMEASIESRFPFLDHEVVRTAVNLPIRFKLRLSPTTLVPAHPFVRDKWVIRKVADRWVPRQLSQRTKLGFWTTTAERMQVSPAFYDDARMRDLLGLSIAQLRDTLEQADQDLRMRLLHLDIWARVCLHGEPLEDVRARLRDHVTIRAA